jgi:hypothetical protein
LEKWWRPSVGAADEPTDILNSQGAKPRTAHRSRAAKKPNDGPGKEAFDLQSLVNTIRDDPNYERYESKVLHADDALAKVKLICWKAEQRLTSGEISRILGGLGVKMKQPAVSGTIARSLGEFLQDGERKKGAVIRYGLTGKAKKTFEVWLNTND